MESLVLKKNEKKGWSPYAYWHKETIPILGNYPTHQHEHSSQTCLGNSVPINTNRVLKHKYTLTFREMKKVFRRWSFSHNVDREPIQTRYLILQLGINILLYTHEMYVLSQKVYEIWLYRY